jgi:hypothetical protein
MNVQCKVLGLFCENEMRSSFQFELPTTTEDDLLKIHSLASASAVKLHEQRRIRRWRIRLGDNELSCVPYRGCCHTWSTVAFLKEGCMHRI